VISDLHWLIHQGHVIEFADGKLDTAKKPTPKPPKVEKKVPAAPAHSETAPIAGEVNASAETPAASVPSEVVPEPSEPAPSNPDMLSVAEDVAAVTKPASEASQASEEKPAETPATPTEPQQ
jgi:hypothetical protein